MPGFCLQRQGLNTVAMACLLLQFLQTKEKLLEPSYVLKSFQLVVIKVIQSKSVSNDHF